MLSGGGRLVAELIAREQDNVLLQVLVGLWRDVVEEVIATADHGHLVQPELVEVLSCGALSAFNHLGSCLEHFLVFVNQFPV